MNMPSESSERTNEAEVAAPDEARPYIVCRQVVKAYQVADHEIVALRGIDFTMRRGEMVAIIGPSGAGKSSLLNLLGGLDRPTAGQLAVDGQNLLDLKGRALAAYRLRRVGFVWQQVDRNLLGHRSALGNVALPMMLAGETPFARRRRALELLDAVGLADHAHKRPAQLSGGQQQRAAIAVALANRPDLLLADEPTGALDRATALQVMALLNDLRARLGLTVLLVTHDLEMADHADRVLTLRDGALGQAMSEADEASGGPALSADGQLRLPAAVQRHLRGGAHIAIEIRPEGVLLRPEADEDDLDADEEGEALPQDSRPARRRGLLSRVLRRQRRNTPKGAAR